jgi:hypothetical protein
MAFERRLEQTESLRSGSFWDIRLGVVHLEEEQTAHMEGLLG